MRVVTELNLAETLQRWKNQSPEALVAGVSDRLPFWLSLGLVVAIGFYTARLVWSLVPGAEPAAWAPPPFAGVAAARAPAGAADPSAYSAIINAHLFGEASAAPEPSLSDADNAPETQLNLELRGAIAAADERFAHAIIADGSGLEKVYFLKDTVPGGAVLQQVQPDRVILSRGGALEVLLLPRESGGPRPAGLAGARQPEPLARRFAQQTMQDVVAQNANSITEIIRPQPYMPAGELKGYRIYPGRNREQFVGLGLKPGDLVTEINGMALNNPAQAMEMFRALADTTQVTMTIERDGQAQSLTLDTNQIASVGGATQ